MGTCHWLWNNIRWVLDITYPNNCPEGQECEAPATPGVNYGDQTTTNCGLP